MPGSKPPMVIGPDATWTFCPFGSTPVQSKPSTEEGEDLKDVRRSA
jgi:hypothetical protein